MACGPRRRETLRTTSTRTEHRHANSSTGRRGKFRVPARGAFRRGGLPMLSIPGVRGLLTAVGIFLVLYIWECFAIPRDTYQFEPRGAGSFEPSLARYSRLTEFIVSLATGSIVVLAGILRSNGRLPHFYG